MYKYTCIAILCLALMLGRHSLPAQQFANFYPSADAVLYSALPLSNGDILAVGSAERPNQLHSAVAMRLSGNGIQKWAYQRDDTTYSHFITAAERPGGQGYVIGGWSELVPAHETSRGLVALVDTNGTLSDLRFSSWMTRFDRVRIMGNGDYHFGGGIMGLFYSNPPTFTRLTSGLSTIQTFSQQSFMGQESSGGTDVTADGWVSMANSRSFQGDPFEFAFSRHSPSGVGSFYKYITCGQNASGKAVTQLASGNHLYFGSTSIGSVEENVLFRLSPAGNVLMATTFHRTPTLNYRQATSMRLTHPDSVVIWGGTNAAGWICRADTLGNVIWMRDYAIPNSSVYIQDVNMFPNGDLLVTGNVTGGSLLMRTGPTGLISCGTLPSLGTNATFVTGTTTATATSWMMGIQSGGTDSIVHRNTVPILPPSDACNPPCSNSILTQGGFYTACIGYGTTYCGQSPFTSSTNWTFNGAPAGTSNCITVTHNGLGPADTLTLTSVINGCASTVTRIVNVNATIVPGFTFTTNLLTATFTNTSTMPSTLVQWMFGDGTSSTQANPTHTYAHGGTYNVTLQVMGPCGMQTIYQQVTIVCPLPTASISWVATGQTVNFSSSVTSGTPVTYAWTFGDGGTSTLANPSHTYSTVGTRTVCLTVTNLCGNVQACSTIVVTCPLPTATIGGSGTLLNWSFTSTVTSGTPVTYLWNFGDGGTSTSANPSHAYANPGNYNVCLTVTNACGNAVACSTITVVCPLPTVSIGGSGTSLNWNFTSTVSSTSPYNYSWDFGDGSTSNLPNPSYTYTLPFSYTVCLTVDNACGMTTACSTITVSCAAPTAQFSYTGTAYTYGFTPTSVQGSPTSYAWNFGDGNNSSQSNPTHVYATSGSYNVCLTVGSICGSTTWCTTVNVVCPIPSSAYTSSHTGLIWSFFSTPTGGYPVSYVWDFGDGNSSTSANPTHTYASTGTYTICLTATSVCGTSQTCITTAVFAPPPVVTFGASGYRYAWNFTSNVTGSGPFTYLWNFGNGTTSTSANASATYTAPGTYTVCLTVTDAFGNVTTTCMTITVVCPMPVGDFTYTQSGSSYNFLSQASGTAGITYSWDFGDGGTSTSPSPTHSYASSGLYQVCLTVLDSCGADTTCHVVEYFAVGIAQAFLNGVHVWPVPANGSFQIEGEFEGMIAMYDCNGRCLFTQNARLATGLSQSIDVSHLAKAIYLLQFTAVDGKQWTVKLPVN